jgi:hypothetical protein
MATPIFLLPSAEFRCRRQQMWQNQHFLRLPSSSSSFHLVFPPFSLLFSERDGQFSDQCSGKRKIIAPHQQQQQRLQPQKCLCVNTLPPPHSLQRVSIKGGLLPFYPKKRGTPLTFRLRPHKVKKIHRKCPKREKIAKKSQKKSAKNRLK